MEKLNHLKLTLLAATFLSLPATNALPIPTEQNITRIAFGSCNNQNAEQPLWNDVLNQKPDLFIFGGDAVYADWTTKDSSKDAIFSEILKAALEKQNQNLDYQKAKAAIPIIGVWDDHDFAYDNADGNFADKIESQRLFLNFLDEPENSPRRSQLGIYTSYTFGEPGKKIKIILLDDRYFDAVDPEYPLLGKTQWDWLERELVTSDASVHFILSGISLNAPYVRYNELWPVKEYNRFYRLLEQTHPKGLVFLSGDKHFSSQFFSRNNLEFLSSGMTHVAPHIAWNYLARRFPKAYFARSYGQIDVSWSPDLIPTLKMSMRSTDGRDVFPTRYTLKNNFWKTE